MKKFLAGCFAAVMIFSSLSIFVSAETVYDDSYRIGDIDGSGAVNLKDSCLLKGCIVGDAKCLEAANTDAGDLVADGVLNTRDSFQLKKLLLGMITEDSLENGAQIYKLTIGGVDISEFTIYTPSSNNDNATYAGQILRDHIEYATGVDLPINRGGQPPRGSHSIVLVSESYGIGETAKKLGAEGYMYKVENGSLTIRGTFRGNMYAVYEILEDYLGFRFTDDKYTFVYKSRYVDIPEGTDRFFEPVLKFRHCGQNLKKNVEGYAFPRKINSSAYYSHSEDKFGSMVGPQDINAHSYSTYMAGHLGGEYSNIWTTRLSYGREKLKALKGEAYESDWQPCVSVLTEEEYNGDAEDYKYYIENECEFYMLLDGMNAYVDWLLERGGQFAFNTHAQKYVEAGEKSISFSQNDNIMNCKCGYCVAKASGTKDYIDDIDKFVGKPEGYSGIYIEAANKAAEVLQKRFPGIRVHTILYDHTVPYSIRPGQYLNVYFCGQGCNNHHLGTDDCGDCIGQVWQVNGVKQNNTDTNKSLKEWGRMCKESGAQLWFWYYGIQYHTVVVPLPNVLNLYYDIKYLYEECNLSGLYYEGGGQQYNFETLKAYMATKMMWEPDMSYEQYVEYLKEYLYIHYGSGYEEIFKFIEMQDTAGKKCGTCFISNFDGPGDCYSYKYIRDHYEEMRELLTTALSKADRADQRGYIKTLIDCFDFLGLSCSYWKMYHGYGVESDAEKAELKALYEKRYTALYTSMKFNYPQSFYNLDVTQIQFYGNTQSEWLKISLPDKISYDASPAVQIYGEKKDGGVDLTWWTHRDEVADFFVKGIESDAVES